MDKKHGMPLSALYLQSIGERRSHMIGRIDQMLSGYDQQHISISNWESNQLKSAIDFIADELLDLADSELAALMERQAMQNRGNIGSVSVALDAARDVNTLSLAQLRTKLRNLGPGPANSNIASQ